jgi:hypothetical protein
MGPGITKGRSTRIDQRLSSHCSESIACFSSPFSLPCSMFCFAIIDHCLCAKASVHCQHLSSFYGPHYTAGSLVPQQQLLCYGVEYSSSSTYCLLSWKLKCQCAMPTRRRRRSSIPWPALRVLPPFLPGRQPISKDLNCTVLLVHAPQRSLPVVNTHDFH